MSDHYQSLLGVSDRIRQRETTSVAITTALLERIARYDPLLHATLHVPAAQALAQARAADAEIAAGQWRGPLHGIPIGVKDLLWTRGLPTTGGMDLLRDFVPAEDATAVARLRQAGAVLIAKLHTTEAASLDHHPAFARPLNPWSAAHWPGASSSGSGVATAAGLCFGALGTDTGGSIRMPSSANNLTGIKPTWGLVSRHGLIPMAETLDTIGPMARSAADAAAILQAIAGPDPADPTALRDPVPDYLGGIDRGVAGLTLGFDRDFATSGLPEEIVSATESALSVFERLGMRIVEVTFPWRKDDMAAAWALFQAQLSLAHDAWFPQQRDRYGPRLRAMLDHAGKVGGRAVARALLARERFRGDLGAMFGQADMVLTPGLGKPVPEWRELDAAIDSPVPLDPDLMRFTSPFNVAGTPTISLPAGVDHAGLPLGIQLAGPALSEPLLIRAGAAFQTVTDFHTRHPDLDALVEA